MGRHLGVGIGLGQLADRTGSAPAVSVTGVSRTRVRGQAFGILTMPASTRSSSTREPAAAGTHPHVHDVAPRWSPPRAVRGRRDVPRQDGPDERVVLETSRACAASAPRRRRRGRAGAGRACRAPRTSRSRRRSTWRRRRSRRRTARARSSRTRTTVPSSRSSRGSGRLRSSWSIDGVRPTQVISSKVVLPETGSTSKSSVGSGPSRSVNAARASVRRRTWTRCFGHLHPGRSLPQRSSWLGGHRGASLTWEDPCDPPLRQRRDPWGH